MTLLRRAVAGLIRYGLLPVTLLLCAGAAATAEERIRSFHSDIMVHPDGAMTVTETITVRAEGKSIRRGIYRDFPTRYRDHLGNRYVVDFEVMSVTRDGRPESWHSESLGNGERIYIGSADRFLKPGVYTYALKYWTNRQLGFFDDHHELYWNVTGNDWAFPIDEAGAEVVLPVGVPVDAIRVEAYTGVTGARGQDYEAGVAPTGEARFETTRSLAPGEGLTIVVSWPPGYVEEPSAVQYAAWLLRDNAGLLAGIAGLLLTVGWYWFAWNKVGRDPPAGVPYPRFEPPSKLSPAAVRYIERMGYDQRAFAAAIINLAVKGAISIIDDGDDFTLSRNNGEGAPALSAGERRVLDKLLPPSGTIKLERKNHARISKAIDALKDHLRSEYHRSHFNTNAPYMIPGVLISLVTLLIAGFGSAREPAPFLFLSVWLSGWTFAVLMLWARRVWLMAVVFSVFEIGALIAYVTVAGIAVSVLLAALVGTNVLFYYLLKAPTRLGQRVMDGIEGFRQYLAMAEKDRLRLLHPPERTPELFERYLPYALALDVEHEWSAQFADVLARAGQSDGGYRPGWYHGHRWRNLGAGDFSRSLSSSMTSAIASSSTAPGSSSGGGGGGSSGGGGGGGGGGGW